MIVASGSTTGSDTALAAEESPLTRESTVMVNVTTENRSGSGWSGSPSMSADGRYVTFQSLSDNLVAYDGNCMNDIFRRDLLTGTTILVSVQSSGSQANGHSGSRSSISADGRYVAFESAAADLVTADTNGSMDIFMRDTVSGTTMRVSVDSSNGQANDSSYFPAVSADGRYVVFYSDATNLVANDTNGCSDIFIRDLTEGTTTRLSVDGSRTEANDWSIHPSISADGRYVAFCSLASNLVADDTNASPDIFVRDLVSGSTVVASVNASGVPCDQGGGAFSSLSSDGRYVAFGSTSDDLVNGDTNEIEDVFVRDLVAGTTTLVSLSTQGAQGDGASYCPSISADGDYVAFSSDAANLVSGDLNATTDVFVRDLAAAITTQASVSSAGLQGDGASSSPDITADGSGVAFASTASNLSPLDANNCQDIFVYGSIMQTMTTIENSDPGVTFARYFSAYGSAFSGGSYTYAYSRAPFVGTKLEARFYGNQVQWIGPKQPNYGKAKVYIDDVYKETVDCYQASGTLSTVIYDSGVLSTDGWHTITIEMVDGKNAASTNYVVVIDCFEVYGSAPRKAGTRTSETEGTYLGGWVKVSGNPTYTDSSYAYSYWTGARFFCNFTGTKVTWVGPKVYNYGRAAVYVDGGYKGTVSQYAPSTSTAFRARVWESATFTSGRHYLEIRPLATKEAASSGKVIVIDAIDVTP